MGPWSCEQAPQGRTRNTGTAVNAPSLEVAIHPIRHQTASTFLFSRFGASWRMCVIEHPRHGGYLAPGGHVRELQGEAPQEAAIREALEETGYLPRLLPPPPPVGYPHPAVPGPWWTVDIPAGPDGRTDARHLHRDHIFVGVVPLPYEPQGTPELPARWVDRDYLEVLDTPTDTKVLGAHLFDVIGAATRPSPAPTPDKKLTTELVRRMRLDQEARLLPAASRTPQLIERWQQIDRDNRIWLEQLLASRGWPGISEVGQQAAAAAWMIAQHSDSAPRFQLKCRDLLAEAVLADDADPQHSALLQDRVRVAQGQPQIFGTQLHADGTGELTSAPIWDAEQVARRRLEVGLEPLEDYLRACRQTAAG
ncbi:DUF6624 domain-containing protein [Streptomyces sp. NPDC051546]|uniref:DUF6624 domain-containing protein n=1 Tax=Streptomyces sp. NPDC051546 TaxID=3365655 RepID=UPI0037982E99